MNLNYNITGVLLFILIASFFMACNSGEKEETSEKSLSIPEKVSQVVGVGRILPEGGIVDLATDQAGIINQVEKFSGDSVKEGETILILNQSDATLEVQRLQNEITAQQHLIESNDLLVKQYQTQLEHKEEEVTTGKELFTSGNETRAYVRNAETERDVLKNQILQNGKTGDVNRAKLKEMETQLRQAQDNLDKLSVKAPFDGVLLAQDAKVGAALQPFQSFARLASDSPLLVEGEVDEMFANRLEIGQKVSVHYLGNKETIAQGVISYLSPDLKNKSLFNEEPNELQDRRVREFKVRLDEMDHLLLNSKVECNIQIQ